jgi:NitT/TauT family transport system substrate-binding protein
MDVFLSGKYGRAFSRKLIPIVAFFLLAGCSGERNEAADLTTVRVGITKFWGEAAFYVAQAEGFFKEEGLDVIAHPHSAGKKSLKKLYEQKVDIAHVAEIPVVFALSGLEPHTENDISLKIFTGLIYTSNSQQIIARRDRGINGPQDLNGKKVGLYFETTSEYFFDTFLLEHGLREENIERIDIDISEHFEALTNGHVDAVVSWEPYASKILRKLSENTVKLNSVLGHSTLWMATSSETYIRKHPDTIVKYLRALKKSQDYIQTHREQTQKLVAKNTNTSLEIIRNIWASIDYELSIGERMLYLLNQQQRWLVQEEHADDSTKLANISDAIYFEALEKVYPEGITVIR